MKLKLATEIASWLVRQTSGGWRYGRCHVERLGPTTYRAYHSCGHTSLHDASKEKPRPLSPKEIEFYLWRWDWRKGGVSVACVRCYRAALAEARRKRMTIIKVRNLGRVGPDWEAA